MIDYPVVNPSLQGIFDPDLPNSPALWAVLLGKHAGKAVVDDDLNPAQCMLRTNAALSYFSQPTQQDFLDQALPYFRRRGPVWLVWPHRTALRSPEPQAAQAVNRVEFMDYDPHSNHLDKLKRQLPDSCRIQFIDQLLLERCEWRSEMEFYAGSLDNFLEYGLGMCLLRGDEILAEAYASALGKTRAEIGAFTSQAYRGRGYATITCAYLIEACEQRGYQAYWSCDADHAASIRVARKLGFRQERPYYIYEYTCQD